MAKRPAPISEHLLQALASVAHSIWRERIDRERFVNLQDDENRFLHLYEKLSPFDRDQIATVIRNDQVHEQLFDSVQRATEWRELGAMDLHHGARVRLTDDRSPNDRPEFEPTLIGCVVDWTLANPKSGRIDWIRVKWEDGTIARYAPCELELVLED